MLNYSLMFPLNYQLVSKLNKYINVTLSAELIFVIFIIFASIPSY